MIVVIVIGVAIATKGQFTIFFNSKQLGQLGEVSFVDLQDDARLKAVCGSAGSLTFANEIRIENARWNAFDPQNQYGSAMEFFILLELNNRLALGYPEGADRSMEYTYKCQKDEDGVFQCGGDHTMVFNLDNPPQANNISVHVTAWRASQGMRLFVKSISTQTYEALLDKQSFDYLGSIDFRGPITLEGLCNQHLCEVYDTDKNAAACTSSAYCYWTDVAFDADGFCSACPSRPLCAQLTSQEACTQCNNVNELESEGCTWEGGFFGGTCKSNAGIKTCDMITDQTQCNNYKILDKNYCYYDVPTYVPLAGTGAECRPCPAASNCGDYKEKDSCTTCSQDLCQWKILKPTEAGYPGELCVASTVAPPTTTTVTYSKTELMGRGTISDLRPEVQKAFDDMKAAAKNQGIELCVVSGQRSFDRQLVIWNNKFSGLSGTEQQKVDQVSDFSAVPGLSRHHWGTEVDINGCLDGSLNPSDFAGNGRYASVYTWLRNNAANYGFCQPYNQDRAVVKTEAWHWSYEPVSRQLTQQHMNLVTANDVRNFGILGENTVVSNFDYYHNGFISDVNAECLT